MTTTLRPEDLSFEAREHYEAGVWQREMHPDSNDFYPCKANATAMLEYMKEHRLTRVVKNFERAFQHLKAAGMLLNAQGARMNMPDAEYQEQLTRFGVEVFDPTYGKSLGRKWPEEVLPSDVTEKPSDAGRVWGMTPPRSAEQVFPNGKRYRPTRAEWSQWAPDRLQAWCELNGYTDEIPDNAFRD
jgi:hypothetical protein